LRRDVDAVREQFDAGGSLVPSDRQTVWDAWRETNQFVWQRLTGIWDENERHLRDILANARQQMDGGNTNPARQTVSRFYEALRTHECRQNAINALKGEAEAIRQKADQLDERRAAERVASQQAQYVSPVEGWRTELERNRELAGRLEVEVATLERQFKETGSILEQAMIRGNLVEKRRKLSEIERASKGLEQRIDQSEDAPLISAG
jgi:DNA-binding transcriptional regulator YhcF (GntR family)